MRRLARSAFTAAAVASLLMCHTACVLWARSYTASDILTWTNDGGSRTFRTAKGSIELSLLLADWSNQPASSFGVKYQRDEARGPINFLLFMCHSAGDVFINHAWAGLEWHARQNEETGALNGFGVVPFWSVAAVGAVLPFGWTASWWRSRVRRRRELLNL